MDIGASLGSWIRDMDTSAAAICRATGIKPASMSKYLSGQTEPPFKVLESIALQLGIKVCQIVARAEGVKIVVPHEDESSRQTRLFIESLDERDRYKVAAIVEIMRADSMPNNPLKK